MTLRADQREWDDLARRDAMWAVCSLPDRRGAWSPEEFFATGEAEVRTILGWLEEHGALPRLGRALDFGCGLGRLTRALSSRFDEVVGVDISDHMLREARALNADRHNCRFLANDQPDLQVLPSDHFDLVLSLIALQHVSSRAAIRAYIAEFVRVAAPGGSVVFQVPSHIGWQVRFHPLRFANRALRALPRPPGPVVRALVGHSMRLVALPESEVRDVLVREGATLVAAVEDGRGGSSAIRSVSYVARPREDRAAVE
jgi:SAM-dependent methyltransferase